PLVPGLVYEQVLSSNKLLRSLKALHHKHKVVVCKIFQHRELLEPQVLSEIVYILKKLRK
ncbi:unnamed protein product, partial [Amoebophrya sp. A25]